MPYKDFREFLNVLEAKSLLKWVGSEVDKDWELGSLMRTVVKDFPDDRRFAIGFRKVKGFSIPVVVGVTGTSLRIASLAMECEPDLHKLRDKIVSAIAKPIEPELDDKSVAPCKENIIKDAKVDLNCLPIPTWIPGKEPGPYITGGISVTKDSKSGIRNLGLYRHQLKGKDKLGIQFDTIDKHAAIHFLDMEREGKSTPIAIFMGCDPVLYFASQARAPFGFDEYSIAGGLRGEPVKLVKCETVDLEVPAAAEIVIEGEIQPNLRESEGPFGEYTGFMSEGPRLMPLVKVKCITHRTNPIYQGIMAGKGPSEGTYLSKPAMEGTALVFLRDIIMIPGVSDLHVMPGCTFWVSIKKTYSGQVDQIFNVISGTLGMSHIKWIIVTDEDVDLHNPSEREAALAFRVRPEEDIRFSKKTIPLMLDPSASPPGAPLWEREGTKIFIDATKKWKYAEESWPSKELLNRVKSQWSKYNLPGLEEL